LKIFFKIKIFENLKIDKKFCENKILKIAKNRGAARKKLKKIAKFIFENLEIKLF